MRGVASTITSKGQITLPAEVRRYMDLKEGDRILFVRDAERVTIEKLPLNTPSEEVFGSLSRPGSGTADLEGARARARSSRAARHYPENKKSPDAGREP